MDSAFPILIFGAFAALVIVAVIFGALAAKKRREAFVALAARLGLAFSPDHDRSIPERLHFLNRLAQGSNRYAYNVLSGNYQERSILVFDYHYQTESRNSKGHRQVHHHHFSCFVLQPERPFPELTIAREGIFSKVAQAFGYDDIDFESHEFSRKFCVRSKDKKFAYDVCHARMIEYLLANEDLSIEIENMTLALLYSGVAKPEEIEPNLQRLAQIRELMPKYLFAV